ncbi:MAG TPA: PP2C family serine/threonine-protein phosphatase [Candidatus Competibacter sp.]|nr:protein phosphatase 2C domain-containing protein [Candidatus Competibacteraceae bacterium]HRW64935.1 PP2C family serine/threonine-protein phosphatase [Candidatus Competibacter sp.]
MSESDDWRYVHASVAGVAHLVDGIGCQDACAAQLLPGPASNPVLVLAATDGAGSATLSGVGAELACQTLLAECAAWLASTPLDEDWMPTVAEQLFQRVRNALERLATDTEQPIREFACTLLGAVVAADRALFLQIGDGAIVIGTPDEGYRPVFWPQGGEYANETYFVTDAGAAAHLEYAILTEPIVEIALLTDGLQRLALHYRTRQAHQPFFRPLFQRLREHPEPGCPTALVTALERLLASPAINQRTHDDKTLILATRLAATRFVEGTTDAGIDPLPPAAASSGTEEPASDPAKTLYPTAGEDGGEAASPESALRDESGDEAV